ncbi:Cytochrome c oxidase assembly protein cox11, mitochondrial, variant 2 [Stylosanthes scabra]|nr:Cytochrome c oxidase assembly protein cox11, mitochondrial, variant 2 [Stylosanthes scabra]
MLLYLTGLVFGMVGVTYAAVPLYRRFCQATGYGGTVQRRETVEEKIARHDKEKTVATREIVVQFNADIADGMPWKFVPTQRQAAVYFNKIQCFCFEEQRLLPGEQIDMPVFFYIDPEIETDPRMDGINNIILSYTFFKARDEVLKDRFHEKNNNNKSSQSRKSSPPKENTKPQEFKLHTQERAVKRAMFNYAVTTKLYLMEIQKRQVEKLQKMIEEEEIRMLRKEMVPRAQLMPYFDKPFLPQRSSSNNNKRVGRESYSCLHMMSTKCLSCRTLMVN